MKKLIALMLMVFVLTLSTAVYASPHHKDQKSHKRHKWSHSAYHNDNWRKVSYEPLPFVWYESHKCFPAVRYRMERIHDRDWDDRFPGLHAYKWHDRHGEGFWYHGRRITDAVLFYNDSDELVSVGFMHNGVFIFIRDDDNGYENHDSFFIAWWNRH